MSNDLFRKSVMNRLPAALPPTRAPWAPSEDDEGMEELDDEDEEALGSIGELPQRAEAGSVDFYGRPSLM